MGEPKNKKPFKKLAVIGLFALATAGLVATTAHFAYHFGFKDGAENNKRVLQEATLTLGKVYEAYEQVATLQQRAESDRKAAEAYRAATQNISAGTDGQGTSLAAVRGKGNKKERGLAHNAR